MIWKLICVVCVIWCNSTCSILGIMRLNLTLVTETNIQQSLTQWFILKTGISNHLNLSIEAIYVDMDDNPAVIGIRSFPRNIFHCILSRLSICRYCNRRIQLFCGITRSRINATRLVGTVHSQQNSRRALSCLLYH